MIEVLFSWIIEKIDKTIIVVCIMKILIIYMNVIYKEKYYK